MTHSLLTESRVANTLWGSVLGGNLSVEEDHASGDALVFIGHKTRIAFSREDLLAWASGFGNLLLQGTEAGERVGILGTNSPEHLSAMLGAMMAGNCCVLLNPEWNETTLQSIIGSLKLKLVLSDHRLVNRIPAHCPQIPLSPAKETTFEVEDIRKNPGEDSLIMFTSGSTGVPKAVPISADAYTWTLKQFAFLEPELRNRRVLVAAPLFHMNAQFHSLVTLAFGGTVVLAEEFSAAHALELIHKEKLQRLTGVPTMFEQLLRVCETYGASNENDKPTTTSKDEETGRSSSPITSLTQEMSIPKVTSIAMGSAPASTELFSRLKCIFPEAAISNGFGTTETGPAIFGVHPKGYATPPGSIGYPMPAVAVRLIDENGHDADRGELLVRSPMVARGYLNNAAASSMRFRSDWYHTGDVFHRDKQGFFFVDGRTDDMFNVGGHNLYPAEVETRLVAHSSVLEACVVPKEDPLKGAVPVAFVVAAAEVTEQALKQHCLTLGPAWAHPRRVQFINELPLTPVKKVDRKALSKLAEQLSYRSKIE